MRRGSYRRACLLLACFCLPACLLIALPPPTSRIRPTDRSSDSPTLTLSVWTCVCVHRASPCLCRWRLHAERPGLRRVCGAHVRVRACVRWGSRPGSALSARPVPFRGVSRRAAPLATRYPQQFQPARPPDWLPVSHRTPNRLHSEAIREPFSASLPLPPCSYALSSAPHFALLRHPRSFSLVSLTAAPILSPFFSSFAHTYTRARKWSSLFLLKFSPSPSVARGVSSHPTLSHRSLSSPSSASRVTLGERTSTGYRSLRLLSPSARFPSHFSPSCVSSCLSLSLWRVLASRLIPPSRHSTLPPRSACDSTVLVSLPRSQLSYLSVRDSSLVCRCRFSLSLSRVTPVCTPAVTWSRDAFRGWDTARPPSQPSLPALALAPILPFRCLSLFLSPSLFFSLTFCPHSVSLFLSLSLSAFYSSSLPTPA